MIGHDEGPVPAVAPSAGPRLMLIVSWLLTLLGVGLTALLVWAAPAPLADLVGQADTQPALVTHRSLEGGDEYSRGCHSWYEFQVAWADREGHFTVCLPTEDPLADLEVGDEVVVTSVPWSDQVTPEGREGSSGAVVGYLLASLFLAVLGLVWVRRYRRVSRGTASGVRLTGEVTRHHRNALHVGLDTPGLKGCRLVLLTAKQALAATEADPVEVWSTRRTLLRRRPAGPWVVEVRGSRAVFTHAWLRHAQ